MTFVGNSAGLNLSGNKLQIVEIAVKGNEVILENADEENLEDLLTADTKESKFISQLQGAFENFSLRKKPDFSSVSFSLPADFFLFFTLPIDPKLLKAELEAHIRWEFSILFPKEKVDEYIIQKVTLGAKKNNLFVICIKKEDVKKIHKFCMRNNLRLKFVDFSHLTVHNYLCNINLPGETILSLYLGFNMISAAHIKNGQVEQIRLLNIVDRKEIHKQISQELTELFPDLNASGEKVSFYLSGDELTISEAFEFDTAFNLQFKKVDPFVNFKKNAVTEYFDGEESNTKFISAASMALRVS